MRASFRRTMHAISVALVLGACSDGASDTTASNTTGTSAPDQEQVSGPTFTATSYWNTPATGLPAHPESDQIIDFLKQDNSSGGCPLLSGTGDNEWGMPFYSATSGDPVYAVERTDYVLPPEFEALRIPRGARPMPTDDGEMVIFDRIDGIVSLLYRAQYDRGSDTWSAEGGSVAYLDSNGLDGSLPESDEPRNGGTFRGYNGAVTAVRLDEVRAGSIPHVVKIGVRTANRGHIFPMIDSDGHSTEPYAPRQGMRLRIKPSVDLSTFELHPDARVIAEAIQTYGLMIADSTGSAIELKLEATVTEGRGQLWPLTRESLCAIPLDLYEIVAEPVE